MLCPNCEKHQTSIVSEKYDKKNNSIKRNRYCICGNSFDTYEKIKKSGKRKPRKDTEWKNCRFCLYAIERLLNCLNPIVENMHDFLERNTNISRKISKTHEYRNELITARKSLNKFFLEGITKKGGKNYFRLPFNEEFTKLVSTIDIKKIKFINKKETINKIVHREEYWQARNYFLNKPTEDMKNKSLVRKEVQEYYKSVCDYIKQPQYNKEFFIRHQPDAKYAWNTWWDLYLKVR